MESKDKNKEETSKKDKDYGKKVGRPKISDSKKYRGNFYRLEARCKREQSFLEVFRITHKKN